MFEGHKSNTFESFALKRAWLNVFYQVQCIVLSSNMCERFLKCILEYLRFKRPWKAPQGPTKGSLKKTQPRANKLPTATAFFPWWNRWASWTWSTKVLKVGLLCGHNADSTAPKLFLKIHKGTAPHLGLVPRW